MNDNDWENLVTLIILLNADKELIDNINKKYKELKEMENQVTITINKEDLRSLYQSYLILYSEGLGPQDMDIQREQQEQKERIDKLIKPILEGK